ncbi:hypothetical protein [uncultured Virgibacillus sp.]|uniref:hypothetical protein n=1 Tax=uncultured Virgibacillus sp. TaxID=417355 RepID=UPI002604AF99|nr:hypothetical protein [uncultured Virgibacillus sp.]
MLVPQGYDLKAFELIRHLLAVEPTLTIIRFTYCLRWGYYCQLYVDKSPYFLRKAPSE